MSSELRPPGAIDVRPVFAEIYHEVLKLLAGFEAREREVPAGRSGWRVREVVAHLIDGDIRRLSFQRDGLQPLSDKTIASYEDLLNIHVWLTQPGACLHADSPVAAREPVDMEGDAALAEGIFKLKAPMI